MANRPVVPKSKAALNNFKLELADELGIENQVKENHESYGYLGNITSKEAGLLGGAKGGNIGGEMVKRMIETAEKKLVDKNKHL